MQKIELLPYETHIQIVVLLYMMLCYRHCVISDRIVQSNSVFNQLLCQTLHFDTNTVTMTKVKNLLNKNRFA